MRRVCVRRACVRRACVRRVLATDVCRWLSCILVCFPPFRPFCQSVCLSHITVNLRVRFRNMEYVLCNIFDGICTCPIPKIQMLPPQKIVNKCRFVGVNISIHSSFVHLEHTQRVCAFSRMRKRAMYAHLDGCFQVSTEHYSYEVATVCKLIKYTHVIYSIISMCCCHSCAQILAVEHEGFEVLQSCPQSALSHMFLTPDFIAHMFLTFDFTPGFLQGCSPNICDRPNICDMTNACVTWPMHV